LRQKVQPKIFFFSFLAFFQLQDTYGPETSPAAQ
jgi:hypothetical protein